MTHLSKLDRIRHELAVAEHKLSRNPHSAAAIKTADAARRLLAREEAEWLRKHFGPQNAEKGTP
jgi:hypothetical protein